jgi:hypothetical protein
MFSINNLATLSLFRVNSDCGRGMNANRSIGGMAADRGKCKFKRIGLC